MPFTEALKNSSAVTAWKDHEERFTKHLEAIRAVNEEFQRLQGKEWSTFSKTTDLGKLYYEYILTKEAFDKEFSCGLPMLKEKYVAERTKVKTDLEQEIKQMLNNWARNNPQVHGLHKVLVALKSRNNYSKYCRLSDQWWKHKSEFEKEKAIDDIIKESARSTRVSSSVPKLHEIKSSLDLVFDTQRSLIKPESVATTLAHREKQLKEIELILQKSTVEWIAYVENPDLQEQKDEEAEDDQPKADKLSKTHDESALKDSTVVAARAPDVKKRKGTHWKNLIVAWNFSKTPTTQLCSMICQILEVTLTRMLLATLHIRPTSATGIMLIYCCPGMSQEQNRLNRIHSIGRINVLTLRV